MPAKNDTRRVQRRRERRLNGRIASIARQISAAAREPETHFHSGPQTQHVPCFDRSCPYPRRDAP